MGASSGVVGFLASAGDQALAAWLGRLKDASFSRAGAVRKALVGVRLGSDLHGLARVRQAGLDLLPRRS